jgi:hypothetical protein
MELMKISFAAFATEKIWPFIFPIAAGEVDKSSRGCKGDKSSELNENDAYGAKCQKQ